MENYVKGNRK